MTDRQQLRQLWTQTPVGQRLLRDVRPTFDALVRRMHGDTLLWCGEHAESLSSLQRSMVRHRFVLTGSPQALPEETIPLVARTDRLPFTNSSMDGIVLHHALEPLADPRDALREIARVLHPGGRLVIVAFNPWSLLGTRRLYARFGRDAFTPHHFVNPVRLLDWLGLLGLELEEPVQFRSSGLPFHVRWRRWFRKGTEPSTHEALSPLPSGRKRHGIEIPLGDVYLISAVKQTYDIRRRTTSERVADVKLAGAAYTKTAARLIPVDFRGEGR